MKIQGHPWPEIRTWPARTQQPAGSLFVSMKKLDSMASPHYWHQTDKGLSREAQLLFCQGNKPQLHGSFVYLFLKVTTKDKWPCWKSKQHKSIQGSGTKRTWDIVTVFPFLGQTCLREPEDNKIFHCEPLWAVLPNKCCLALTLSLCPRTGKVARMWPKFWVAVF